MNKWTALALTFLCVSAAPALADDAPEINTTLMRSTFKLSGAGSTGTAFIIGRFDTREAKFARYVLVTAAHVLQEMKSDDAVLLVRTNENGEIRRYEHPIKVKNGGRQLWTKHPGADVGVMYVQLPAGIDLVFPTTDLLATDEMLQKVSIHPGDRLSCLGFPYGLEANDSGFAVLRTGYIASYPITPTKKTKTLLLDFNIAEGNSGGPVYFVESNRPFGGSANLGRTVQFIVGLVSQQSFFQEEQKSMRETRTVRYPLGIGIVVHASLIREAIALLPQD